MPDPINLISRIERADAWLAKAEAVLYHQTEKVEDRIKSARRELAAALIAARPQELVELVLEVVTDAYQEGYNDGHADAAHEEGLDAGSMHEGTAQAQADLRQRVVTVFQQGANK